MQAQKTPGYLSPESISLIEDTLSQAEEARLRQSKTILEEYGCSAEQINAITREPCPSRGKIDEMAADLFKEFQRNLKAGANVWEIISDIRHLIYTIGIYGGADGIEDYARKQKKGIVKEVKDRHKNSNLDENAIADQARIIIKSLICLRVLATVEDQNKREEMLGMVKAKHLDVDTRSIFQDYFTRKEGNIYRPIKTIDAKTPIHELIGIIALSEMEEYRDIQLIQKARILAHEFLLRKLVTTNEKLIEVASKFFTLRYYKAIIEQRANILSKGRIGGKSTGILLGYAALEHGTPDFDEQFALSHRVSAEELHKRINLKECLKENTSTFLDSEIFEQIISYNSNLADCNYAKTYYRGAEGGDDGLHRKIEEHMPSAEFSPHIERQLKIIFQKLHGKPIIVRSSSELEDRIGAAFSGKYTSVYLANSGDAESDFEKFKKAILEVYASVFSKDVMEYRRQNGLLTNDEEMGILIQSLNGTQHGDYFYPDFSAVGYSHAPQSFGADPTVGSMRIGAGLGEKVVSEGGGRFVMFAKPSAGKEGQKPQDKLIVINLKTQEKEEKTPQELQADNGLSETLEAYGTNGRNRTTLTFENLLDTEIPLQLEYIVRKLRYLLGFEVDCEFTIEKEKTDTCNWIIKLVQCRPLNICENLKPSRMPKEVPTDRILFKGKGSINSVSRKNITHIVYIDPKTFACGEAGMPLQKRSLFAQYIHQLNAAFADRKGNYLIVNPKRWGSKDPNAGIPANFADFSNAAGTAEIFDPGKSEPSSATHFLQDFFEQGMAACNFETKIEENHFLTQARHSDKEGFPEIPQELSGYIKIININNEYAGISGIKAETGWRVHIAQDNTCIQDSKRPSHVYIAQEDCDLPVDVLKQC